MGINVILAELGYVVLNWKCPLETSVEVGFVNLCSSFLEFETVIVIVGLISKFLKRYSKPKRTRSPAYSRALRRIKGRFPKGGQEKLRSDFQSTRRVRRVMM